MSARFSNAPLENTWGKSLGNPRVNLPHGFERSRAEAQQSGRLEHTPFEEQTLFIILLY